MDTTLYTALMRACQQDETSEKDQPRKDETCGCGCGCGKSGPNARMADMCCVLCCDVAASAFCIAHLFNVAVLLAVDPVSHVTQLPSSLALAVC